MKIPPTPQFINAGQSKHSGSTNFTRKPSSLAFCIIWLNSGVLKNMVYPTVSITAVKHLSAFKQFRFLLVGGSYTGLGF